MQPKPHAIQICMHFTNITVFFYFMINVATTGIGSSSVTEHAAFSHYTWHVCASGPDEQMARRKISHASS